nr:IS4 family transposase [uncultured Cocleimonas sp.]
MLNTSHRSIKSEVSDFFLKKSPRSYRKQLLSKGAFTKARSKFKETALIELLQKSVSSFYRKVPLRERSQWHGFRTLAVDGSDLALPDYPDIRQTFGAHSNDSDVSVPMAKLSFLYDTFLDMPIDVQLDGNYSNERELAVNHLSQTGDNDLMLYDRGYYAYWFVLLHTHRQREFCFRLRRNANRQVQQFIDANKKQAIITLEATPGMRQQALEKGLEIVPVQVRLIRIKTSKGSYVLMTSLTDTRRYPAKHFYDLYHLRWRVEEGYKKQKAFLDVEDFSGRTVHSIKQDVHASAMVHALVAMECFAANDYRDPRIEKRKHRYKINFAEAIQSLKRRIIILLTERLNCFDIYKWLKAIATNLTIIKSGRSFERTKVRCRRKKLRKGYKV